MLSSSGVSGLGRLLTRLAILMLLTGLVGACGRNNAPAEEPLPAHLRVVPCGGAARMQLPDSSEWVTLDTEIAVGGVVPVAAEGENGARLCFADGSLLELNPSATVEMRPSEDRSRLVIDVREGQVRLSARQRSYGFTTGACPVNVSYAPARLRVAQREGVIHLMVEQGSAVCAAGAEPTLLPTCWELVAAPGAEPEIAQYCGQPGEAPATETPTPTSLPPATTAPTPNASPGATSAPPEATSTPEPTPIP